MSKWDETVGIYDYAKATGHSVKHIYEQIRLGKIVAKKWGQVRVAVFGKSPKRF